MVFFASANRPANLRIWHVSDSTALQHPNQRYFRGKRTRMARKMGQRRACHVRLRLWESLLGLLVRAVRSSKILGNLRFIYQIYGWGPGRILRAERSEVGDSKFEFRFWRENDCCRCLMSLMLFSFLENAEKDNMTNERKQQVNFSNHVFPEYKNTFRYNSNEAFVGLCFAKMYFCVAKLRVQK